MEERLKILVVDEDDLARKVFRLVVNETRLSLELWEVSDSKNVFCVLESARFDCIFLGSPLVDGTLTLIDKLHFSQIKVPLVILTSPGEEKTALNLLHNGATDYLNKSSLTPEILSITLRNAIRLHSFGFWALMCFLLEASPWQGTWGKRLMGIKVVNGMNEPLSWGQSLKRNVLKIPAYLCFGLGFLWILLNKNRSGIYDAFAHTKVVNRWE